MYCIGGSFFSVRRGDMGMVGIGRFIYNSFYLQHLLYSLISLSYTFNLIKLLRSNA